MKDKVESGFGMNDEKKYFYALNENRFKFGLYRTSISELKRAYPKLKAGDTISRAELVNKYYPQDRHGFSDAIYRVQISVDIPFGTGRTSNDKV